MYNDIKQLAIPVPVNTPRPELDKIFNEDHKQYIKYFNAIRDYIINNIDYFSTKSLIKAMETYHDESDDIDDLPKCRLKQAIDVYNYCKEYPNNVEENDRDFILGALFVSNFKYCSYGSDAFSVVDDFLASNEFGALGSRAGYYCLIRIIEIGKILKLLIPEFSTPQPKYHYIDYSGEIEDIECLCGQDFDDFPQP